MGQTRQNVAEARRGDAKAAARRLRALRGIPRLAAGSRGARLAEALLRSGALPRKAEIDAVHVGVAAVNGIDYLLTWNLPASCERRLAWEDRGGGSGSWVRAPRDLYARGADGAEAMTRRDPIVEEVRKHRAEIAREHGNDVAAIVAALEGEDAAETAPWCRSRRSAYGSGRYVGCERRGGPTRRWSRRRETDAGAPRLNANVSQT